MFALNGELPPLAEGAGSWFSVYAVTVAGGHLDFAGFADGSSPAMLGDQQVGLGLSLGQFLLELAQCSLQIFDLSLLIGYLLGEAFAQVAIAFHSLQGGTRQVIFF